MTSMPRVSNIFFKKNFEFLMVILVPFEILSQYPNFYGSNWLMKDVQRNLEKLFRETLML